MKNYTLKELIKTFWKSFCVIIGLAIVLGSIMGIYAKHKQVTSYTASRSVIITHNLSDVRAVNNNPYDTRVNADLGMMPTYANIATNERISVQAHKYLSKKLQRKYSIQELNKTIHSNTHQQSLVLTISSRTNSASDSVKIVNATAKALKTQLPNLQPGIGNIILLQKASNESVNSFTKPSIKKYIIIGVALGSFLGILISFIGITFKSFSKKAK